MGIWWQTGQPVCAARAADAALVLLGGLGVALSWWLAVIGLRREPALSAFRRSGLIVLMGLAWAMVSAGLTGWRASERLSAALPDAWVADVLTIEAQVEGLPRMSAGAVLFDARVLAWVQVPGTKGATAQRLPERVALRMTGALASSIRVGQRWRFRVMLHAPDGLSNPGGLDSTLSAFERGVRAEGKVVSAHPGEPFAAVLLDGDPALVWQGAVDRFRHRVRDEITRTVADVRAAGILAGLAVGDQSSIDAEDWLLFRQTGITHLVSISGAHVAMFGWLVALVVRWGWSRWPRGVAWQPAPVVALYGAVCGAAAYAVVAGWGVPAQRTVWMMLISVCLRTGARRWPWPWVCLASAVILTVWDPWCIRQVGFWLSYAAVAVLLQQGWQMRDARVGRAQGETEVTPPRWQRGLRWLGASAWALLRLQALLTWALLPLSLVAFHQSSWLSLPGNLLAIPFFSALITPMALLGMVWAPIWQTGAWVIHWQLALLQALAGAGAVMVEAPVLPAPVVLAVVVVGLACAWPMPWRWRLGLLPWILPLWHLPMSWQVWPAPRPGHFSIMAVDVGQGSAVLVRTARHAWLVDSGPRMGTQYNAGEQVLLPLLRALGIDRLEALVLSHEDSDHVGGAAALIGGLPIAKLISPLGESHALRRMPGVHGQPLPHEACQAGTRWQLDGVWLQALHPRSSSDRSAGSRAGNEQSCVIKVSASGPSARSVLITGDIEAPQERALVASDAAALRSEVLIAPHHGSRTSSTEVFLAAVAPAQVVVQVGRRNRYGHPAPEVLARYEDMGLPWVASPACGAFMWSSEEAPGSAQAGTVAQGRAAQVSVGRCWRVGHQAYWDRPSPMPP